MLQRLPLVDDSGPTEEGDAVSADLAEEGEEGELTEPGVLAPSDEAPVLPRHAAVVPLEGGDVLWIIWAGRQST